MNNSCCKKQLTKQNEGFFSAQICLLDVEVDSLFILRGVIRCRTPLLEVYRMLNLEKNRLKIVLQAGEFKGRLKMTGSCCGGGELREAPRK